MALGSCYIHIFFQTHFRSVKFKGLPPRNDASNSERTSYHDSRLWKKILTSSERFTSVSYGFHFWIGSQSVGITFTIQFFQVQLDWSRRNLSLPIEHLFLDWFPSIGQVASTSPLLCTSILVFVSIFKLILCSMLNENFFLTCKVKRWRKLEIVAVSFSSSLK